VLEFDTGVVGGEVPVGLGVIGVAVVLPGGDLVSECLLVGDAAVEALAGSEANPLFVIAVLGLDPRTNPAIQSIKLSAVAPGCPRQARA
jgi:hypothetical protein